MMFGAIRSYEQLTKFKKAEEMRKKTKEKIDLPQALHGTLHSPVDTAQGNAFPAMNSSVMSVSSDDVD